MAAGTHHGDAHRGQQIAECGGLSRTEDNADSRESDPERTYELNELAVGERMLGLVFTGGGAQARKANGELGFPADFLEVFQMGGEGDRFEPPIPKSKERADTDTAEARFVAALRAIQPPAEIFFRTIHVSNGIGFAMVGLLINNEPLGSGGDKGKIVDCLHRGDFDREGWDLRTQPLDAHS